MNLRRSKLGNERKYMNPMKINDFLNIKDAADYLGVTVNSLRNWDKSGTLKAQRNPYNNYRMYSKESLNKVLMDMGVIIKIDEIK